MSHEGDGAGLGQEEQTGHFKSGHWEREHDEGQSNHPDTFVQLAYRVNVCVWEQAKEIWG